MPKVLSFLFLLVISYQLNAQIYPQENSTLHYRIIGFSFPKIKDANNYTIEIAAGNNNTEDAFKKNIIISKKTDANKLIVEVPSFGKEYTWRSVWSIKGATTASSMHHFSCVISSEVDTNVTRLRILKKAEKYKDAYVFMDGSNTLYDMDGNPVWYVPVKGKLNPKKGKLWDMKLTPDGTITFLLDQNIYEINYDGDILWKGPNNGKVSGDSIEYYHHELMKLTNGHYMVLGTEFVSWAFPGSTDSEGKIGKMKSSKDAAKQRTAFGTIIEYDHDGNVIWSWKSSEYFKNIDPKYLKSDFDDPKTSKQIVDVHANAFYFDEKEKVVYFSFKNISSIIKIKYPEGNVLNTYGRLGDQTAAKDANEQFCGQHSCKTTKSGYLFLYNNNACHKEELPKIMIYEQPEKDNSVLKKIWEYSCSFNDVIAEKQKETKYSNDTNAIATPELLSSLNIYSKGGNVIELPDQSIFASICGIYGKVFIITPEKETVWSGLLETWNQYQRKWEDIINYKANIIVDPKELERVIWNSEK